ncbi:MAG: hypothetical protein AVDCRST_MAG35-1033, partial [uncultured Quadrisphaera sp.]
PPRGQPRRCRRAPGPRGGAPARRAADHSHHHHRRRGRPPM